MIHTAAELGRATVVVVVIFTALATFATWFTRRIEAEAYVDEGQE